MLGILSASLMLGLTASAFALDDLALRLPRLYNAFVPPPMGQSYTDSAFGVGIKRVSNARQMTNNAVPGILTFVSTEYPTASPFNSDNTRLLLQHQGYFGLYDGNGTYLKDLAFAAHAGAEPRWSRTDPNALFYVSGNRLMKLNVDTGVSSLVRAFSEYAAIRGRGESDISMDGDHFVFSADELSGVSTPGIANRYVFVYQISTNTKGTALDTIGHPFNQLYLAPDNSVALGWLASGTARFTGVELFDRNMAFVRQLTRGIGHMRLTRDVNGDGVLIWANSNDPQPIANCPNGIVKVRLKDAHQTCLLALDWSLAVHITAPDGNGWAFVGTYDPIDPLPEPPAWKLYSNEILQIKLDGTETRRLAHHRSRQTANYPFQPRASVSRDGGRLVFTSNFGLQSILGYPFTYTDAYFVAVPATVPPRISISDASGVEGDTGTSSFAFTLSLSGPSDLPVSASFATADGTASASSDYTSLSGTLTFTPGETSKVIVVSVGGDTTIEKSEKFLVNLSNITNAATDDDQGVGTIFSDEGPPTATTGVASDITQTTATLSAEVSPSGKPATAHFEYGLTTDYGNQIPALPSPGSGFSPSAVSASIAGLACSSRYHFRVSATNSEGTTKGADGTFRTALCDGISIDEPSITEGDSGDSIMGFTVHVQPPHSADVTLSYTTLSGTATAGSDYTPSTGVFTIPAFSSSKSIPIVVRADRDLEPDETVTVTLSGAPGVAFGKVSGTGTIVNDDPAGAAALVIQYRLYHEDTKEHLYTTNANEYQILGTRGWVKEGVAYRMLSGGVYKGVGTIPLFRLYHPGTRQHLWTTHANEVTTLAQEPHWFFEGTAGYLLPTQVQGAVPLYRMVLQSPPLHLWTTDANEHATLQTRGWLSEGIIGYVLP